METIKEKTDKDALTEYLTKGYGEATEGMDSLGSWLRGKWDEHKHKRDKGGKFATSEKTIEKQDELDPNASPEEDPEDKRIREAIEEGTAMELAYESVEEFRADKNNYNNFLKTLPLEIERYKRANGIKK